MPATPGWIRRNRFAIWSGYVSMLIAFASLGIGVASAGDHDDGWAVFWACVFLAAIAYGITVITAVVHRDRKEDHPLPSVLGTN